MAMRARGIDTPLVDVLDVRRAAERRRSVEQQQQLELS